MITDRINEIMGYVITGIWTCALIFSSAWVCVLGIEAIQRIRSASKSKHM